MYRTLLLLLMVAVLCGCAPQRQEYKQPGLPIPPAWQADAPAADQTPTPKATEVAWRDFFTDEELRSVIELALDNNRDLRMAALNVEKFEALYRIQRSELYPQINAAASGNAYRIPERMSSDDQAQTFAQYTLSLGVVSWELDLFGRIRSLKSAALAQYLATEEARSATQVTLVSAVANTYLALAADRTSLRLAQATLGTQQDSYDLIARIREAGIGSDLDVQQSRSQVEAARADVARYSGQVTLDKNALNLLVGTIIPDDLLPNELGAEPAIEEISAGLSSDVLLERPDILSAEQQLRAAYADIDAARATFFPRITLTGAGGLVSSDLVYLFRPGSATWNFAPQVVLPIFDRGARKANYKVAEVDRDLAVATYEQAIQTAFREVSDSLTLRTRLLEQQEAQQALVTALDETYRLSQARYKAGIDSYLSVLVAQRSLYFAQQVEIALRLARFGNLIALYKALGGGM